MKIKKTADFRGKKKENDFYFIRYENFDEKKTFFFFRI